MNVPQFAIDPVNRHEPVRMADGRVFNRKHTYSTGRSGNVWFTGFRCPVCGATTSRPRNPFRGRKVGNPVCDGITYSPMTGRPVKRPARLKDAPPSAPSDPDPLREPGA